MNVNDTSLVNAALGRMSCGRTRATGVRGGISTGRSGNVEGNSISQDPFKKGSVRVSEGRQYGGGARRQMSQKQQRGGVDHVTARL